MCSVSLGPGSVAPDSVDLFANRTTFWSLGPLEPRPVRSPTIASETDAPGRDGGRLPENTEVLDPTASVSATSDTGHEEPAPRRILIFVVVGLALLMSSLDGTIVATALHAMKVGLHASINWTSWSITAYSVGMVMMLPLAGKLSGRYGRRRFFLASVIVFAGASLCCGLATNIYVLIALRAVQAAGGAGFTPSATGIVVEHFGSSRDKAVGLFGSIFPIGSMIGPIFGGIFVAYWSWRGIFFVNVPIGILLLVLGLKYVPRDRERRADDRRPLDFGGMATLGIGTLSLMIGISFLGEAGTSIWSPLIIGPAVVAILALGLFGRHIRRVSNPFIEPHMIHGRGFAAVNVINILYGGAVAGLMALVPLYAVTKFHINALGSGTLLTAEGAAVIVVSSLAAMALRRTGYRLPLYIGSALVAVGMAGLALHPSEVSAYTWLAIASFVVGLGTGLSSPASRNAGLQLAPDQSAPLAALRSTGRQVGQIASISITTAILAQAVHPAEVQAKVYVVFALLLIACMPVIARIPEHRGSW
jgi:EmrB/QacA subfamily drug resistance transporter